MKHKMPFFSTLYKLRRERFFINPLRATSLAHEIKNYLFESIYENDDTELALDFQDIYGSDCAQEFILRTTISLHKKMSVIYPNVEKHLSYAVSGYITELKYRATYIPNGKCIIFNACYQRENLSLAMNTISHEYTHVLQVSGYSTIGKTLSKFIDKYWRIYEMLIPYKIRINEKESHFVGKIVGDKFRREFRKYVHKKESATLSLKPQSYKKHFHRILAR